MGIASLVLGILSIVIGVFLPGPLGWLGAILGIVGIVFGASARKNSDSNSLATAGLVCSIIGTILSLILYVACVACISAISFY